MGLLKVKIGQLSSELVNRYCMGEKRYLNKNKIIDDISMMLYKYLIAQYKNYRNKEDIILAEVLNNEIQLQMLVNKLRSPLMVVKKSFLDIRYGIDEIINDEKIKDNLKNFFQKNSKLIDRNLRRIVKKDIELLSNSSGSTMENNLEDDESSEYIKFEMLDAEMFDKLDEKLISKIIISL